MHRFRKKPARPVAQRDILCHTPSLGAGNNPSMGTGQQVIQESVATMSATTPRRSPRATPASRRGKKALIGYFDPEVSKQLKQMALDQDRHSVQDLLREALNDLFRKYKKRPIA